MERKKWSNVGGEGRKGEASELRRSSRALYLNVVYDTGSLPMETRSAVPRGERKLINTREGRTISRNKPEINLYLAWPRRAKEIIINCIAATRVTRLRKKEEKEEREKRGGGDVSLGPPQRQPQQRCFSKMISDRRALRDLSPIVGSTPTRRTEFSLSLSLSLFRADAWLRKP